MHTCEKIATRGDFCAPFFFLLNKVVETILGKIVGMFPIDCISLRFTVRYPADYDYLFLKTGILLLAVKLCKLLSEDNLARDSNVTLSRKINSVGDIHSRQILNMPLTKQ